MSHCEANSQNGVRYSCNKRIPKVACGPWPDDDDDDDDVALQTFCCWKLCFCCCYLHPCCVH